MLTGVEEFFIFGFMPLMIGIFTAPLVASSPERTVSGKVTVPPSLVLPAVAVAIVELVELCRGETVVPVLARETINWRGAVAQKFAIRFDPSLVRPTAYYALRARIIADGAVLLETRHPQLAAPLSGDQQVLALTVVSA
jgi:putative lipoprotein